MEECDESPLSYFSQVFSRGRFWVSSFKGTGFSEDGCGSVVISGGLSMTLPVGRITGIGDEQQGPEAQEVSTWGDSRMSRAWGIMEEVSPKPTADENHFWGPCSQPSEVPELSHMVSPSGGRGLRWLSVWQGQW